MYTWVKPKSFMAEGEKHAHMVATPLPEVGDATCRRIYEVICCCFPKAKKDRDYDLALTNV